MSDTIRAAFESWAKQEFSEYFEDDGESMFDRAKSNNYNNLLLRNALAPFQAGVAWQASLPRPSESKDAQPERVALSDAEIRSILMAHGFKIHEGMTDLKPYVYEAVRAIIAAQSDHIVGATKMVKPFCADCGKRNFVDHIHTCTPPAAEATRDDGPDLTNTVIPAGSAYGSALDQLYAAFHREPCGDTLAAIGCAIQELQALEVVKRDGVVGDAAHHRLLNAATTYANNYLQDERDEPELCIHTGQHAEIVELFAAIATNAKEKT